MRLNQYHEILNAISIIFRKVLDGIDKGNRVHVPIDHNILPKSSGNQVLSLDELEIIFSQYEIIESDSSDTGSYLCFRHYKGNDVIEAGDFIYLCKSGLFHLRIDSNIALFDS